MSMLLNCDVQAGLGQLADESVHCVVTSPPYWGLRNYGMPGQMGLEATPEEYIETMVAVFREVRRVLRRDGTCWINMGDCYASNLRSGRDESPGVGAKQAMPRQRTGVKWQSGGGHNFSWTIPAFGSEIKPKDLVGIPWRLALALQADGWYLRCDIIWAKPNPMPESVTDRPTKSHEYVFLLTKSARYFYDQTAVREVQSPGTFKRYGVDGKIPTFKKSGGSDRKNESFAKATPEAILPNGRNRRSVWTIATQPYPECHFATFPEKLARICILAGTSAKGCCPACGAPWERVEEKGPVAMPEKTLTGWQRGPGSHDKIPKGNYSGTRTPSNFKGSVPGRKGGPGQDRRSDNDRGTIVNKGWRPTCTCGREDVARCVVLDPFIGSGTTGKVAQDEGREWIGIELNPDYITMIERRTRHPQETLGL
ncbi:MAG: site-specific DNA-methyltransferase [Chloroflexota bacterium]